MRNFAAGDTGFLLKNAVHNELVHRGWHVTVGSLRAGEADFVAENAGRRHYFQVAETMADPAVYARELVPFKAIPDSWPKTVITADRLNCGITEDGIAIVNAID